MVEKLLQPVRTFEDRRTHIVTGDEIVQYWTTIEASQTNSFDLGVVRFTPDASGAIYPPEGIDRTNRDAVLLVSDGEMAVEIGDRDRRRLNQYDVAYVPAGTTHRVWNVGTGDAWAVWATVPNPDETTMTPRVIHTMADIEPGTGVDPDDIKRYWIPISESHLGVGHFEMGLIFRPPGTEVPLHRHDPPDTREAFVVLEGSMLVEGFEDRAYRLTDYDGLYVPPHGQHSNRNVGSKLLRYVFIETPAEPDPIFL